MFAAQKMGDKMAELNEQIREVNQRFSLINFSKWN